MIHSSSITVRHGLKCSLRAFHHIKSQYTPPIFTSRSSFRQRNNYGRVSMNQSYQPIAFGPLSEPNNRRLRISLPPSIFIPKAPSTPPLPFKSKYSPDRFPDSTQPEVGKSRRKSVSIQFPEIIEVIGEPSNDSDSEEHHKATNIKTQTSQKALQWQILSTRSRIRPFPHCSEDSDFTEVSSVFSVVALTLDTISSCTSIGSSGHRSIDDTHIDKSTELQRGNSP